jgi:hypothetical protein
MAKTKAKTKTSSMKAAPAKARKLVVKKPTAKPSAKPVAVVAVASQHEPVAGIIPEEPIVEQEQPQADEPIPSAEPVAVLVSCRYCGIPIAKPEGTSFYSCGCTDTGEAPAHHA